MTNKAILYDKLEDKKVQCHVCAHHCKIAPDKTGICGVRANEDGVLNALTYGLVTSSTPDPIEKKPLYHFHPGSTAFSIGSVGCNFKCKHCQNSSISFARVGETSTREMSPDQLIESAKRSGCQGIAWTYNEPVIWIEYALEGMKLARENGLYTAYVTNGYMSEESLEVIAPYLDAANVDVKAFRDEFYKKVCGARLEPVLNACEQLKERGVHLEVTYLVIPTYNDDPEEIKEFAEWAATLSVDTPIHFSRFHPMGEMSDLPSTPVETLEKAYQITRDAGMQYVYLGNVYAHEYESTFCPQCGEVVIKRTGYHITDRMDGNKCPKCGCVVGVVR